MVYSDIFRKIQNKYIDYPDEITIETTGKCNAKCKFCPHYELDRRFIDMEDSLFFKIIGDLKEIPINHKFNISPFKVNEPLMDNKFFEKIGVINTELPNANIRFFSNFNMATFNDIERLSKIKNLDTLWISLNEIEADRYKEVMGLELDKTLDNIKNLLEFNKKYKIIDKVSISRVADDTSKDIEFKNKFDRIFGKYSSEYDIKFIKRAEWIDFLGKQHEVPGNEPCLRWFEVNITCTGKVALCCMDGKGEYCIGDVNEQSVLEIYNRKEYRELRENIYPRKFIAPCNRCSL
ncbi:radical SAM/SPASM domain-containing protein [Clostridium luticellarii]|nr:radical SAM/SPASM domain-containing protein [Clostridium luticellarii]